LRRIQGIIIGFDEFMNIVLNEAFLIDSSLKGSKMGQVLIKGDCIVMISEF